MIIVEGVDGAGKTTLIRQMTARYGLGVAPRVVSKEATAMVDLRDWVENNLEEGAQWKIFDRHRLISETIYGPILRDAAEPGFSDWPWLAWKMREFYDLEPVIIYCIPPLEVVKANIENDPENEVVAQKIESLYQAYVSRAAIDNTLCPGSVIIWDYTSDGREDDPLLTLDWAVSQMRKKTHS